MYGKNYIIKSDHSSPIFDLSRIDTMPQKDESDSEEEYQDRIPDGLIMH